MNINCMEDHLLALLCLISPASPKVLVAHACENCKKLQEFHFFTFTETPKSETKFDISAKRFFSSKLYFLPFPLPLQKRPIPHSCQKQTLFSKSNLGNHVAKTSKYHLRSNIFDQLSGRAHCFHNFDTHQSSCFNIYGNASDLREYLLAPSGALIAIPTYY